MDLIKTQTLLKADGSKIPASEALAQKNIICLYFSAHWCPPCRGFTPQLKKFYDEHAKKEGVEIIFVSADQSEDEMINYMKESHGDWYAMEHECDAGEKLNEKFKVRGIPTLIVLDSEGNMISKEGRADVSKGAEAIEEWKKGPKPKVNPIEMIKSQTLVKADGSKTPATQALNGKSIICLYFSAHWCPPCRRFTPELKKFYEQHAKKEDVEIVFMSADQSPDEMISYMKDSHGDWFAMEHGCSAIKEIGKELEIEGIPSLIVLKPDGTVVNEEGTDDISKGADAIKEWKK